MSANIGRMPREFKYRNPFQVASKIGVEYRSL